MKLTTERQKETGAFYTPKWIAELAVKYIQKVVPVLDGFMFYDCAAGEGALLDALPESCEKYATTLEAEDVDILRDKGYTANQFDFLGGNVDKLGMLWEARHENRLIVFTNPPYVKLPAGQYQGLELSTKPLMQLRFFTKKY